MIRFLLPLMLLLTLAVGCASISKPEGWAPPIEVDQTLYVSLDKGEITALSADEFEMLWTFPEDDEFACGAEGQKKRELDGIYGAPSVGDEFIYIGAYDDSVYAITKEDGSCAWRASTGDPIVGGTVLNGDKLYVPSTDGSLYVLDPETGDEIDRSSAGEIWSTPLLIDDALYVSTMEGRIRKLDTETLNADWTFDTDAGLLTSVALIEGTPAVVVAGGIGETLFALDAATGDEVWSFEGSNWFWGEATVGGEAIYATNLDGRVYAIDSATGNTLWSFDTEAAIRSRAVLLGDDVIVVNDRGDVYSLNAVSGDVVWGPIELDESVYADPLLQGDAVLIVTRGGDIISIDADGRPTTVVD